MNDCILAVARARHGHNSIAAGHSSPAERYVSLEFLNAKRTGFSLRLHGLHVFTIMLHVHGESTHLLSPIIKPVCIIYDTVLIRRERGSIDEKRDADAD